MVKPIENNGGIRIRFTYDKRRFNLTLKKLRWDNRVDRAVADAIAAKVTVDIDNRVLDKSLQRYRLLQATLTGTPVETPKPAPKPPPKKPTKLTTPLAVWDAWIADQYISEYSKAGHYHATRRAIERDDLFRDGLSAYTHNLRRRLINQAYNWAIDEGLCARNPYAKIRTKRAARKRVEIFKTSELKRILGVIDNRWPCYSYFVRFLAVSGCRFGEAAGVQGRNIDLERGSIYICTSLRYNIKTRQMELREGNKTETYRELESPQLINIIQAQGIPTNPLEPVFKSPKGKLIRRNVFNRGVWKPALTLAEVPYRVIHTLRHTALSMALQDLSVPDVAYLAGHRDNTMVMRTYGHIIDRPKMPEMDL